MTPQPMSIEKPPTAMLLEYNFVQFTFNRIIIKWICFSLFCTLCFPFREEGIEPLLELEDVMSVEVPEPKSLITYVHFIYQHFAEKQQQQKKA